MHRDRRMKFYTEAGLAVLLILSLSLAGRAGIGLGRGNDSSYNDNMEETSGKGMDTTSDHREKDASDYALTGEAQSGAGSGGVAPDDLDQIREGQYPIMGESSITAEQLAAYYLSEGGKYPAAELESGGAATLDAFCTIYCEEARAEGVRPEVAFVQTMKETGFLRYGGDASISQFNFAGLGTTGEGVPGESYPDVRTGVRAQIQHLKAYATSDPLAQECVDQRYEYVRKGSAPYVEWLGQQENPQGTGWAVGENYGYDIVQMIRGD